MPKKLSLLLVVCFFVLQLRSQTDTSTRVVIPHVSPSLRFTENLGQWQDNVLCRAQLDGGQLYLEKNCLTFNFYDKKKLSALHHGGIGKEVYKDFNIKGHTYRVLFEGSNPSPVLEKLQAGKDYENFYIGKDQKKWKSEVKNYHQVWLRNLYNDIDYEVFTAAGRIKYNFHIKAGANAAAIKLRYEGVDKLKLKDGVLYVGLSINSVTEQKPFAYQMINGKFLRVTCNYKLNGNVVSFDFPNGYNKNYELVIDPLLVFAAQSGSTTDNWGSTATFDNQGNLYAGGTTTGSGYPTTIGAYDNSYNSTANFDYNWDIVVTKYNSSGTALLYSTYLGGGLVDVISSMIVDNSGHLCLYGATGSSNFPMVAGAYDTTFNGGPSLYLARSATYYPNGSDIYLAKFNSGGTALLASTYIGGSDNDGVNHTNSFAPWPWSANIFDYREDSLCSNYGDQNRGEIQVDVTNNIYITSSTRSSNFPTINAFDNSLGGKQDAIVAKFNSGLSQLLFSTYLGGSSNDCGNGLLVNDNLEVYVTGGTCSNNFPATSGAFSTNYNGGKSDGFIAHFNVTGNQVLEATYVGTSSYDNSFFIQSDTAKNIYVYGQSLGNMPVMRLSVPGLPYNNPGRHQFINRFNKTLSIRNLSTVFGSKTNDIDISPCAFAVDKCNNIYISGWGGRLWPLEVPMSNMPLVQSTQAFTTGYDFYFMGLDMDASSLLYGSYFGGSNSKEHVDGGTSRFDPRGRIYQSACAGCNGNDDWPVTLGAWPNIPGNSNQSTNCNNGVVKLDFLLQLTIATINTATFTGCAPFTASLVSANPPLNSGATFLWDLGNGLTFTTQTIPPVTYLAPGIYTVTLEINDNLTCNKKDKTTTYITVLPQPSVILSTVFTPCTNTVNVSQVSSGNFSTNPFVWNFGDGSPTITLNNPPVHTYTANGTYTISFTAKDKIGCSTIKTATVNIFDFVPKVNLPDTICYGKSVTVNASGGTSYSWLPINSLNNGTSASPVATPSLSTIYTVVITNNTPGYNCAKTLTTQLDVDPTPTVNFSYTVNPCGGGVYFKDLSINEIESWKWTLNATKTSTVQNPYNFYFTGGTHTVTLESTNVYGCKSANDSVIKVLTPSDIVSAKGSTLICKNDKAPLSAEGGLSYVWTPSVTLDFPAIASPIAIPLKTTEYSVNITTGTSNNGKACEYLLTALVNVEVLSSVPIKAKANPELIVRGDQSTLTYLGDPGAIVTWFPAASTKPSVGYVVTAEPQNPTTYTVVASKGPCTETITVQVDAYSAGCLVADVFIPNTFTPNGDGSNDVLYARSGKIDELYFAVYNRWGEMVFETKDKSKGWDGTYKGKALDVGVFGWYLKAKCVNGEETFLKGNVTLIR
jgi:gliding motility-associated-like protein